MSVLVLDAGALIAIDRGDRDMLSKIWAPRRDGEVVRTNAMALAQAWRDRNGRQAPLSRALRTIDVRPIHADDGRKAGELLATAGMTDAIDATLALLARSGDQLYTSDVDDLRRLCEAAGNKASVIRC
jgi:hypothetical protein